MTVIILVRHSVSEQNPGVAYDQWGLSSAGLAKCRSLAARLQYYEADLVVTSPEPKAYQTASEICSSLGTKLEVDPALIEHRRQTEPFFDNRDDFVRRVESLLRNPDRLVFGEETGDEARQRFQTAVERHADAHGGPATIVVSHATVMSLFLANVLGLNPIDFWRRLGMPGFVALQYPEFELIEIVYSVE